ncbi:MFS transporter [Paenibacillus sp. NPDC058071]|uniref:MFS transporter n=1 Tax=Paenibacillus sp. NPDC058071 TaxID=3346326 RepID=UPI0036DC0A73
MEQGNIRAKRGGRINSSSASRKEWTQVRPSTGGKLDAQAVLLLAVNALYAISNALSGTFLPVYLWKASGSYLLIGWFSFGQFLAGGLTFWLAGKWVKEGNKMNSLRLGILLSGLFFLTVLLLGKQATRYGVPLGMLSGTAMGFYWLAYNVVYFEITEPDNRDRYNGWAGLLGSAGGMIAPWISGYLITTLHGERGYRLIFTLSLIIFGVACVLSFWLRKREKGSERYSFSYGFRRLQEKGNPWRRMFAAVMAQGVREGVFMFLVGLTVYIATSNESKLGNYTLLTSLIALVSFWVIGKRLTMRNRNVAMLAGTLLLGVAIMPLFWGVSYSMLLMFGIGTSLFMPLYIIPMTSRVFDLIGSTEEGASNREEYIVLREAALTLGRLIGLSGYLILLPINHSEQAIVWLMFIVGIMPVAGWYFMRPFLLAPTYVRKTR